MVLHLPTTSFLWYIGINDQDPTLKHKTLEPHSQTDTKLITSLKASLVFCPNVYYHSAQLLIVCEYTPCQIVDLRTRLIFIHFYNLSTQHIVRTPKTELLHEFCLLTQSFILTNISQKFVDSPSYYLIQKVCLRLVLRVKQHPLQVLTTSYWVSCCWRQLSVINTPNWLATTESQEPGTKRKRWRKERQRVQIAFGCSRSFSSVLDYVTHCLYSGLLFMISAPAYAYWTASGFLCSNDTFTWLENTRTQKGKIRIKRFWSIA